MFMTRRAWLGFASALLAACSSDPSGPRTITELPRPLTQQERTIASAANSFSFGLFRTISAARPGENVFISPLSASMALGMTMNGAAGTTLEAMRATLGFGSLTDDEINQAYESLIALLRGVDPTTDFRIANSVWYRQEFPFEQSFITTVERYFDAEVRGLDFTAPASLTTINDWTRRATNGKIPTILDQIGPSNVMFLINAIYFKGQWRSRFAPSATIDAPFHAAGGIDQPARLMYQSAKFPYLETADFQAVELQYGNSAFAMTVLLPRSGVQIDELASSITESTWTDWTGRFTEAEVRLHLPKLRLEYERTMNDDLTALGMGVAFTPGAADFTRLSSLGRDLFISFVKQKTFVEIDEEGTEAAAATVVGVDVVSAPLTYDMRVDQPYVIVIRERFSGTILFIGKITRLPA